MIPPTELIAHAIPRLLEEEGLRPHAPVGDEIVFEGERADDPFWVMITPLPRDPSGARRAMESLAGRFQPAQPPARGPTRGLGLLVLLATPGAQADLAAIDATLPTEGTAPVLRAAILDLGDGTVTGNHAAIRPMASAAKTIERAARAAIAGKRPPDLRAVVDRQVNLSRAFRAVRPWTAWAITAAIVGLVIAQRYSGHPRAIALSRFWGFAWRWDVVLANTLLYPVGEGAGTASLIWLVLTVIGVLSLGTLLERLYGRGALLGMWFAPCLAACWLAHRFEWEPCSSPVGAMFGLTGCTLAMGFLRRALPWPFRRSLLVGSAPMIVIFAVVLFLSGIASLSIAAAVLAGGLLAAVLPFRAPISEGGGPVALRAAAWALALACLAGVGLAVHRTYLRPEPERTATDFTSEEGWVIAAPPGYWVETPPLAGTVVRSRDLSITIETEPLAEAEPIEREIEGDLAPWRRGGARVHEEAVDAGGRPWRHVRIDLAGDRDERWYGDVGALRVRMKARGELGALMRGAADVRAVVESFRLR